MFLIFLLCVDSFLLVSELSVVCILRNFIAKTRSFHQTFDVLLNFLNEVSEHVVSNQLDN